MEIKPKGWEVMDCFFSHKISACHATQKWSHYPPPQLRINCSDNAKADLLLTTNQNNKMWLWWYIKIDRKHSIGHYRLSHTQKKYIEIYFKVSKIYVVYILNTLKYICIVVHLYLSFWNIFWNITKIYCEIYLHL